MPGRAPKQKGSRFERSTVNYLRALGFACERVPLSGAAAGYPGDISLPLMGDDLCVELKCRASSFRSLYGWLENRDLLILKADRKEPLVVLPLSLAAKIAWAAEKNKGVANCTCGAARGSETVDQQEQDNQCAI